MTQIGVGIPTPFYFNLNSFLGESKMAIIIAILASVSTGLVMHNVCADNALALSLSLATSAWLYLAAKKEKMENEKARIDF